jgi:hypothetical protein
MPAFPLTRKPTTESIRVGQHLAAVRETQTSVGPGKRRRTSTLAPQPISMRLDGITEAQRLSFESWYATSIAMGALSFTMDHPWKDTEMTVRFDLSNGFEWSNFGELDYSLTMNLEILAQ